jgi:ribosome-binding protein aMBF1 (putative translation factor)
LRLRKQALGSRNLVGARVEEARKDLGMKQKELLAQLQVNGVDECFWSFKTGRADPECI